MKLFTIALTLIALAVTGVTFAQSQIERPAAIQLPAKALERVRNVRQPSLTFEVPVELNQIPAAFEQLTVRCYTRFGTGGNPPIMEGETRITVPDNGNFSDTVTVHVYPVEGQDINRANNYVCNIKEAGNIQPRGTPWQSSIAARIPADVD